MKFILLASGPIAEAFFSQESFSKFFEDNLCGIICSPSIIQNEANKKKIQNIGCTAKTIGRKYETEKILEKLILTSKPDYILSIQYPWILSSNIIELVEGKVLNLHNAKLPNYRGHNTISHQILNNETNHTTTLHWIEKIVDRGRIVIEKSIDINPDDTAYILWERSVSNAINVLTEWVKFLDRNTKLPPGKLIEGHGNYYPKAINNSKIIPDGASTELMRRYARAFWFPPHEPAYFLVNQKKVYVLPDRWTYTVEI